MAREKRLARERARDEERRANQERIAAATSLDDLEGIFSTIVVDPPWPFEDNPFGKALPPYGQMSLEEICALPVAKKAAKDAHLYLWIPNRSLLEGKSHVAEAWGFRPVSLLTWNKPGLGLGVHYFRNTTEQVIFAVRGSLRVVPRNLRTGFDWPHPRRHSQKPQEFFDLVEAASPGPYLELFARCPRPGWSTWGAEAKARR